MRGMSSGPPEGVWRRWVLLGVRLGRLHQGKQRLVAIALKGRRVLSVGYNSYTKTHPRQRLFAGIVGEPKREYLHAEIHALCRADGIPDAMVVVRVNHLGEPVCAAPCPVCLEAIRSINPNMKIIHT